MVEKITGDGSQSFIDQDDNDEKEELLEAIARGANAVEDDASRGTLHYGSAYDGEATIEVEVTATDSSGARLSESFTIEVADVNEGPTEVSLGATSVAENAAGATIGTISVVDPDAGDSHSFTVSDDRFEVVEGELRLREGVSLDHEEAATIEVEVTATDSSGARLSESFGISVVEMPEITVGTGFHAQYFDVNHRLRELDDIDWSAEPTFEEVTTDINYANGRGSFWDGGSTDTFGVKINGNVEVTEAGTFNFRLGGDDGAILFVNGQEIIDNDGLHGFRTRTGEIELEPGTHHIEVRYFENTGHAGLRLEWEGPGLDGHELVTSPEFGDTQTVSGVAVPVEISADSEMLEGCALLIEGLPPGTELTAGDESYVVGDNGSADITGWETDVLSLRPPVDFVGEINSEIVIEVPTEGSSSVRSATALKIDVKEAHLESPDLEIVGGFHASYFDVDYSLRRIDDIDWDGTPTHEEMVPEINYENSRGSFWEGGSTDTFGAKLEGQVTIEEGGSYKFYAGGDDGVVLYINGEPVINNDGLHGFRTRSGEVELEPGTYDIEVRYFENQGHAGLRLEWEGPGTDGRELLQADAQMAVEENGTLSIGLDTDGASDSASVEMYGLPADTILVSGEYSLVADGNAVDLTGWDLDILEVSPPPGYEGMVEGEIVLTDTAFNGAETTSSIEFSFSVGDPENAPDPASGSLEEFTLMEAPKGADSEAWSSIDEDMDEMDDAGDVMSERAVIPHESDPSDIQIETYERLEL